MKLGTPDRELADATAHHRSACLPCSHFVKLGTPDQELADKSIKELEVHSQASPATANSQPGRLLCHGAALLSAGALPDSAGQS